MKKLKITSIIILALGAAAAGLLYSKSAGGQSTYQVSVPIKATPETIYASITQPERLRLWLKGYVRSIPLDRKGTSPGARSREIMNVDGKRFEMLSTLTEAQPGKLLAIRLEHEDMETSMRTWKPA